MDLYLFSHIALWVLALILIPLTLVVLYQLSYVRGIHDFGRELSEREELAVGNREPPFVGREMHSRVLVTEQEWAGTRHVVLALSPTCVACNSLVAELSAMTRDDFEGTTIIALCVGGSNACRTKMSAVRAIPVLVVRESEALEFVATGLPSAIMVDASGVIEDVSIPGSVAAILEMAASKNRRTDGFEPAAISQVTIGAMASETAVAGSSKS